MGILMEAQRLKQYFDKKHVQSGTGFYFRPNNSRTVYIACKDSKCITVMTTAYPGHSISTVKHRVQNTSTKSSHTQDRSIPITVEKYNSYMGGVGKSDLQHLQLHLQSDLKLQLQSDSRNTVHYVKAF